MERRIGLFDREPMLGEEGDPGFRPFFARALSLSKRINAEAPLFDARLLCEGVALVRRQGRGRSYSALLNLDGRSGRIELPRDAKLEGKPLMGDAIEAGAGSLVLGREPLVLEN